MKKIAILGSTGSIGTQAIKIARESEGLVGIVAISGNSNIDLLSEQIKEFRPKTVCVFNPDNIPKLMEKLSETARASSEVSKSMAFEMDSILSSTAAALMGEADDFVEYLDRLNIVSGVEGLIEVAKCDEADMVLTAVVGMIGIRPTIAAIEAGKDIALANKETLVCAGHIIMPLAKQKGVNILPVDSEHSAIFQSLQGQDRESLTKILLTASGGPFRGYTKEQMKDITLDAALKHPNWSMGKKITIDSATMVNKGLEVIEAKWLFGVSYRDIQVVVQPQSIIHSMVQFKDGGVIAQLGLPNMMLPIQYAFFYPKRMEMPDNEIDFAKLGKIEFYDPDYENFEGLALAREAAKQSGLMPTILNAANEYAVAKFLSGECSFLGITEMIRYAMEHINNIIRPSVEDILETEAQVYELLKKDFK